MPAPSEPENHRVELLENQSASDVAERLLDVVLHQTAETSDERTFASTVELPRLREVARRYPSDSLTLDPILVTLIDALLETHLPQVCRTATMRTRIAREIARPLFENPVSRGRLELLWSQLLDRV